MKINNNYSRLKDSYLFYNIAERTKAYLAENPDKKLLRLGIGDVTLPLCDAVITALHKAVDDQAHKETFHGYMPECGTDFLKSAVAGHYRERGIDFSDDEVFITCGAGDDLGNILSLFDTDSTALVIEPAYPAYVDSNTIAGHHIIHLDTDWTEGFTPLPDRSVKADIIYICSPSNPTGAVFSKENLKAWVDYANDINAVIIFDAAYEAFIEDECLPHSIYDIEGSRTCAIEICSLSKTAGFTGTRCGYTVVPFDLVRDGAKLNDMWVRDRTTKSNGVSYIIQRGAEAVFTPEGQREIRKNIDLYKSNARTLTKALDKCGLWYCGGKNSPYIWFKCPDGMGSWEAFDLLLNEAQVVTTPGAGFGKCGEGYLRLSAFGDTETAKEAADRIVRVFGKQNKE